MSDSAPLDIADRDPFFFFDKLIDVEEMIKKVNTDIGDMKNTDLNIKMRPFQFAVISLAETVKCLIQKVADLSSYSMDMLKSNRESFLAYDKRLTASKAILDDTVSLTKKNEIEKSHDKLLNDAKESKLKCFLPSLNVGIESNSPLQTRNAVKEKLESIGLNESFEYSFNHFGKIRNGAVPVLLTFKDFDNRREASLLLKQNGINNKHFLPKPLMKLCSEIRPLYLAADLTDLDIPTNGRYVWIGLNFDCNKLVVKAKLSSDNEWKPVETLDLPTNPELLVGTDIPQPCSSKYISLDNSISKCF